MLSAVATTAPAGAEARPPEPSVALYSPPLWDGPIVATQRVGVFSSPATLDSERQTWIHWAIRNTSEDQPSRPYVVSLWLDGDPLANWQRPGLRPGDIDTVLDWPLVWNASHRFAGPHRLTVEVVELGVPGQDGARVTSIFREFLWEQKPPEAREPPRRYSREDLDAKVAFLGEMLSSLDLVSESADAAKQVLEVGDAVYYTLYGKSLYDESLQIHLLNEQQFAQWVGLECKDRSETIGGAMGSRYGQACGRLAGAAGYAGSWRAHERITLRSDRTPAEVLLNLAHELGHFRQSLLRPDFGDRPALLDLYALREAQAYAHEILFLRTLEELAGYPLLLYHRAADTEWIVESRLAELREQATYSEHARGQLLLWMIVLTDPDMGTQRTDLSTTGRLSKKEALGLLKWLLAFSAEPRTVESYVSGKLSQLPTHLPTITRLIKGRLVVGLLPRMEGPQEFSEAALLTP